MLRIFPPLSIFLNGMSEALEVSFVNPLHWLQSPHFEGAMHEIIALFVGSVFPDRVNEQTGWKSHTSSVNPSLFVLVLHFLYCEQDAVENRLCAGWLFLFRSSESLHNELRPDVVQQVVEAAAQISRVRSNIVEDDPIVVIFERLAEKDVEEVGAEAGGAKT